MSLRKTIVIPTLFLLTAILLISASKIQAQGFNVEVSPAKVNFAVDAGNSYSQTFTLGNYSEVDRVFSLYVRDFVIVTEEGGPEFLETDSVESSEYSLKDWVQLPYTEVRVAAGQTREIPVTISVPANAEPGGHYAAFFVETDTPNTADAGSSIGAIGRIASLMLVSVPGDVTEDITVEEFTTDQKMYYSDAPMVEVTASLLNEGNVHGIPTGALFVTGGLTGTNQTVIFNQSQAAVLPGSPARRISESFVLEKNGPIPPMGRFTVELVGRYGSAENDLSATYTFWVVPVTFLVVTLIVIVVLAFVIWRVVLSFKR